MAKKFPLHPKHPERICWGCEKFCSVDDLQCGNGSSRTLHPAELMGEDWYLFGDWGFDAEAIDEIEARGNIAPGAGGMPPGSGESGSGDR